MSCKSVVQLTLTSVSPVLVIQLACIWRRYLICLLSNWLWLLYTCACYPTSLCLVSLLSNWLWLLYTFACYTTSSCLISLLSNWLWLSYTFACYPTSLCLVSLLSNWFWLTLISGVVIYFVCMGGGALSSSVCLLKRKILLSVIQPRQIHYTCNMLSVLQLRQIHYTCHNYYRFCSLLSNRDKFITLVTIIINLALRYPTEANSLHLRQLL